MVRRRIGLELPLACHSTPLLYAIFINDLVPDITLHGDCDCCLFADDVNIWPVSRDADGVDSLRRTRGVCGLAKRNVTLLYLVGEPRMRDGITLLNLA